MKRSEFYDQYSIPAQQEARDIERVTADAMEIRRIHNPSEKVKLAAVTKAGAAIQFIIDPSEAVQLAAVTQNGWAIQYIRSQPSEAVMAAAVKQDLDCLGVFKKEWFDPEEA